MVYVIAILLIIPVYTLEPSYYVIGGGAVLYLIQRVTKKNLYAKYVLIAGIGLLLLSAISFGLAVLLGGPGMIDA